MYSHPLQRGAVYLIEFPLPNPKQDIGKTIMKYILCLQEGKIIENRPLFTAVKLTSKKDSQRKLYPTDVVLSAAESQTDQGVIIECDYVHTIAKAQIVKLAYRVSSQKMQEIDTLLPFALGLIQIEDITARS